MRLRLGLEGGVGAILGKSRGLEFGILGQLGVQFNDHWGLYYSPSVLFGGAGANDEINSFVGSGQLGLLAFNFTEHLEFDAGGGAMINYNAACVVGSTGIGNCEGRNANGAIAGRLALNLGIRTERARIGIQLAFHYFATFLEPYVSHSILFTAGLLRY